LGGELALRLCNPVTVDEVEKVALRLFIDYLGNIVWCDAQLGSQYTPNQQELVELVHTINHRVAGFLEREGILEGDEENSYLNLEEGLEEPMQQVVGCSVSYRIAMGPQPGRKVFTLQTIPAWEEDDRFTQVAKESGLFRAPCPPPFGPAEAVQNRFRRF
jgi:hypothetical protein